MKIAKNLLKTLPLFLLMGCSPPIVVTPRLTLSEKELTISIGEEFTFEYNLINSTDDVLWISSDPNIAFVNAGVVTGVSVGQVDIVAYLSTNNKVSDYCVVNVIKSDKTYNVSNFYDGYYSDIVSWSNGEDLKQQLHDLINADFNALPYKDNYLSNRDADHTFTYYEYLDVIYSTSEVYYANTNTQWQREHVWPATLMGYSSTSAATNSPGMGTDFHNLFASWQSGNSSRGNKPYGIISKDDDNYNDGSTLGGDYVSNPSYFEPSDQDKGRLARAIYYMDTMYDALDITGNSTCSSPCRPDLLLEWNQFSVDRAEMQHNESVYSYQYNGVAQNNRNPFTDYPELVDYIYGDLKNTAGEMNKLIPSSEVLNTESNEFYSYAILSTKNSYDIGETFTSGDYSLISVNYDFSYESVVGTTNYDNHTFIKEDGKSLTVEITAPNNEILSYLITVSGLKSCSHYGYKVTKSLFNITAAMKGVNQTISMNGQSVVFNFNVDTDTSGMKITDNTSNGGGIKLGSGTYPFNQLTISSLDEVKIDELYFVGVSETKNYSLDFKAYLGDNLIYSTTITDNDGTKVPYQIHSDIDVNTSGIFKMVITPKSGCKSLTFESFAFNVVE